MPQALQEPAEAYYTETAPKTEFSTTEWILFIYLISLCFTNPCKLLSSTASSSKGFQALYSQWRRTSF